MIIIGSQAYEFPRKHRPRDLDLMIHTNEVDLWLKKLENMGMDFVLEERTDDYLHISNFSDDYEHVEAYIGHSNNSTEQLLKYCGDEIGCSAVADLDVLYAIKMAHRYKRNSPHFLKTMRDIQFLRSKGANLDCPVLAEIVKLREKETYNYAHPVLNQSKYNFFDDTVDYVYDHDSIHEAVAIGSRPAYTYYMKDGEAVMTSKEKFMQLPERVKLAGVYEEACVLALERSQIPFAGQVTPKDSFITALIKVCTSITSGWFREYAYANFDIVVAMYRTRGETDYIDRFVKNDKVLKPFGWDKK